MTSNLLIKLLLYFYCFDLVTFYSDCYYIDCMLLIIDNQLLITIYIAINSHDLVDKKDNIYY